MISKFEGSESVDLLLISGVQGTGKSTLATRHFRDRVRANLDDVRYFYRHMTSGQSWKPTDWRRDLEPLIVSLEERIIRFNLEQGNRMVVDNTNITRESRAHYARLCQELGRSIGIIFLDLPLDYCLTKNVSRPISVPDQIVKIFHSRRELPSFDEGFDFIRVIEEPPARTNAATGPMPERDRPVTIAPNQGLSEKDFDSPQAGNWAVLDGGIDQGLHPEVA